MKKRIFLKSHISHQIDDNISKWISLKLHISNLLQSHCIPLQLHISQIAYLSNHTSQIKLPIASPIAHLSNHFSNHIAHLSNRIFLKSNHLSNYISLQLLFQANHNLSKCLSNHTSKIKLPIAYLSNHNSQIKSPIPLQSHISPFFSFPITSQSLQSHIFQITHPKSNHQSPLQSHISHITHLNNLSSHVTHLSNQLSLGRQ